VPETASFHGLQAVLLFRCGHVELTVAGDACGDGGNGDEEQGNRGAQQFFHGWLFYGIFIYGIWPVPPGKDCNRLSSRLPIACASAARLIFQSNVDWMRC